MENEPKQEDPKQPDEGSSKPYLKYSGLAFQMIGALVVAAWGGRKLDAYVGNDTPWFTIALLLLAVIASMILTIVSINKK